LRIFLCNVLTEHECIRREGTAAIINVHSLKYASVTEGTWAYFIREERIRIQGIRPSYPFTYGAN